ncbi:uncharacterized protein LOC143544870 [Bidens hawaiensis]|uniref:uncharacterized protein LOC143544870 n=1 Tax=Bidens hawaiensis TaxID=980011 RepID=UPI00404979D0
MYINLKYTCINYQHDYKKAIQILNCLLHSEKIAALLKAANVDCESYWPSLFAKLAEKKNIEDLIMNVGVGGGGGGATAVAAPAAGGAAAAAASAVEEKKEDPKDDESEDDFVCNLFD